MRSKSDHFALKFLLKTCIFGAISTRSSLERQGWNPDQVFTFFIRLWNPDLFLRIVWNPDSFLRICGTRMQFYAFVEP